ncbi:DUF2254 domain-containing protein [Pseudochelatococcus contaminans]|uniref:Putative membrane protein n=1 Tax=Pseudochelatococcus contaminans TaxID=1538103 RepID=A0A7W6EHK6_9HYPH|nr:DUF2254 domain-containing protein [Pseudochelatococcus contaminans]MBB3810168.1 putative membrane protein [Pseudochelatococcus contaminans]
MSRWQWILSRITRRLWVRASLIGALGIVAAVLSAVVEPYIPWQLPGTIGVHAVDSILTIIASSMLAVTTFSLSVVTSAYGAAASQVTPRATRLLIEDRVTQNVLSTFIGSFLFAIVGIVVLKTGAYDARGRVILFIVTIAVIALIVVSLLRWIDHLTRLGLVPETTSRVEDATRRAIRSRLSQPYQGGKRLEGLPPSAVSVLAGDVGYVQHIDMAALAAQCEDVDADIYVTALPGAFLYPDTPIAWIGSCASAETDQNDEDLHEEVRSAFSIGAERSFDQDPRFGLAVMSEIASRALSPATNDPGTAIDVIGRLTRLLTLWAKGPPTIPEDKIAYPRVYVQPLRSQDMFEDAFMLLARDGAEHVEVQIRLQKSLGALARTGDSDFREAALQQAGLALSRAEAGLSLDFDKQRVREAAHRGGVLEGLNHANAAANGQ